MARIPLVSADDLTPEQRIVFDRIVAGPRRTVVDPLRAALMVSMTLNAHDITLANTPDTSELRTLDSCLAELPAATTHVNDSSQA